MQKQQGKNNALSLFGMHQIPSDNQIRHLLDPVPPDMRFVSITTIGDELYCHPSHCARVLGPHANFLLTCKPESHATLYEWVADFARNGGGDNGSDAPSHGQEVLIDTSYRTVRDSLSSRRTFFEHLRALIQYLPFDDWDHLMRFMLKRLDHDPPETG